MNEKYNSIFGVVTLYDPFDASPRPWEIEAMFEKKWKEAEDRLNRADELAMFYGYALIQRAMYYE